MPPVDANALTARASELRQAAERLDALAKRRAELEKEERDLAVWMEPTVPVNATPPPGEPAKKPEPQERAAGPDLTRDQAIVTILAQGPLGRPELFQRLAEMGKAPNSISQLSTYLSRGGKEGRYHLNRKKGTWSLAQPRLI